MPTIFYPQFHDQPQEVPFLVVVAIVALGNRPGRQSCVPYELSFLSLVVFHVCIYR